ncbi:LPS export ABC transporter permease LptF [Pseudochelatococcus sp. B33]
MTLIERYILRNVTVAFVACFLALTLVIWITQILRQLDLVTGQGQTLGIFLLVTLLSLPALVVVIAPVAVFIAALYALNKLNGDSELIVMSAAGIAPGRLLRPFMTLGLATFALVAAMTLYLMPESFNTLRDVITRIRADFVANIVKEGQFTTLDSGITFHYREKSGDALLGIFMQDERDPEKISVYIAERGQTVTVGNDSFLVLENGSVQRQEANSRDAAIVTFQRYALNLSVFAASEAETVYRPRERSTAALLAPDPSDPVYLYQGGRFRAELHDRFSAPLYCISFLLIAFAALGEARTTRQGRGVAIALAVLAVGLVRIIGFFATSAVVREPLAVLGIYGAPLVSSAIALFVIYEGPRVRRFATMLGDTLTRRRTMAAAAGTRGA